MPLEAVVLRCTGARPPTFHESSRVLSLADRVAARMGLLALPGMLVRDQPTPAARAGLHHLVLTRGLLATEDDDQLSGALAHALAHWSHPDAVGRYLVVILGLPLTLAFALADGWMRSLRRLLEQERQLMLFVALAGCLLAPAWLYTRLWMSMLSSVLRWESQERELDADWLAVRAGVGRGLLQALELEQQAPEQPRGLDLLLAEPPATPARLERLARAVRRAEYRTSRIRRPSTGAASSASGR